MCDASCLVGSDLDPGVGTTGGRKGLRACSAGFNPAADVTLSLLQRTVELFCFVLPGAWLTVADPVVVHDGKPIRHDRNLSAP